MFLRFTGFAKRTIRPQPPRCSGKAVGQSAQWVILRALPRPSSPKNFTMPFSARACGCRYGSSSRSIAELRRRPVPASAPRPGRPLQRWRVLCRGHIRGCAPCLDSECRRAWQPHTTTAPALPGRTNFGGNPGGTWFQSGGSRGGNSLRTFSRISRRRCRSASLNGPLRRTRWIGFLATTHLMVPAPRMQSPDKSCPRRLVRKRR